MNTLNGMFAKSLACGVFIVGSSFGAGLASAESVDFSGTWVLQERKSLSGPDYMNGVPNEIKVTQNAKEVILQRTLPTADEQPETVTETLSLNGEAAISQTATKKEKKSRFSWLSDGREILLTTTLSASENKEDPEAVRTERWKLSSDGKTLQILKESKSPKDASKNWSMKGEYALKKEGEVWGIRFSNVRNWQEALAQAKLTGKYLFVDLCVISLNACKKIHEGIYTQKKVGEYFNAHFIAVKVQMDKTPADNEHVRGWYADAELLGKQHNVNDYPTFLMFNSEGKIVHRAAGLVDGTALINLATQANELGNYDALKANYEAGKKDYSVAQLLMRAAGIRNEQTFAERVAKDYVDNYLLALPDDQLYTKENIEFIVRRLTSTHDKSFRFFYQNMKKINAAYEGKKREEMARQNSRGGARVADDSLTHAGGYAASVLDRLIIKEEIEPFLAAQRAAKKQRQAIDDLPWKQLKKTIAQKYDANTAERCTISAQLTSYMTVENWPKAIDVFVLKAEKYGIASMGWFGLANRITDLFVVYCNDKKILNKAVHWEKQVLDMDALDKNPIVQYGDYANYAALLYKAGQKEEGIRYMEEKVRMDEE